MPLFLILVGLAGAFGLAYRLGQRPPPKSGPPRSVMSEGKIYALTVAHRAELTSAQVLECIRDSARAAASDQRFLKGQPAFSVLGRAPEDLGPTEPFGPHAPARLVRVYVLAMQDVLLPTTSASDCSLREAVEVKA